MTDNQKKLLTAALGEKWHEQDVPYTVAGRVVWKREPCDNRTFTAAQDWEDLREKVIVPDIDNFTDFLISYGLFGDQPSICGVDMRMIFRVMSWFLTLSIEERCELVADFLRKEKG